MVTLVDLEYYTVCVSIDVSIDNSSLESALSILHEIDNKYEPKFNHSSFETVHESK